jgi:hypothetical protein
MTALAGWQNFYVIVGSSAGALIGLQFVVLSLMSNTPASLPDADAGDAFATPTIVHFGATLGLSAILSAPWDAIGPPSVLWGIAGLSGVVYSIVVVRRMRGQAVYRPEFEDWLFHIALPFAAYLILAVVACIAGFRLREALLSVGAAALLLLFAGIHNAWDAVTYHVFIRPRNERHRNLG